MFKKLFLQTIGKLIPSDLFAHRFPVSVKGICFIDNKVILLRNERNEWDLPGGKLKKKEAILSCLVREIEEELSISVQPKELLQVTTISIMNAVQVFVVIYSCFTRASMDELQISEESFEIGAFSMEEIDGLVLPKVYKETIKEAYLVHLPN